MQSSKDRMPPAAKRPLPDEQELLDRLHAGDPLAFADLYETYRDAVNRYILTKVRDSAEAEDLTQETFIQAHRSIGAFQGRSRLLTWLLGIARFTCLRFYRFRRRWMVGAQGEERVQDFAVESRTEPRVDARRTLARMEEVLSDLGSPDNRSIFHLRYAENRPIRAIAAEVGKSEEAVKTSLKRSRRALIEDQQRIHGMIQAAS